VTPGAETVVDALVGVDLASMAEHSPLSRALLSSKSMRLRMMILAVGVHG
jgi:hypothetical protein